MDDGSVKVKTLARFVDLIYTSVIQLVDHLGFLGKWLEIGQLKVATNVFTHLSRSFGRSVLTLWKLTTSIDFIRFGSMLLPLGTWWRRVDSPGWIILWVVCGTL